MFIALLPLKTPERKAEAASVADGAGAAKEGSVPEADPETEAALLALAGTEGVTAREREVASGRPHGSEEPEETEGAPERAPEEKEKDDKELELIETTTR